MYRIEPMYDDAYSEIVESFPDSPFTMLMIAVFLVTVRSIDDIPWNFICCLCIDQCYITVHLEEKVKTLLQ